MLIALAALSGAQNTLPPLADIPQATYFRDWIAACNNVRDCEALASKPDMANGENWTLTIKRGPEASALPVISATPSFNYYEKPTRIRIDGRPTKFTLDEGGYLTSNPIPFLKAIARARSAEVVGIDGEVLGALPVMGATASLRWIDDQHKRAGTVTAILANASKPESAVPAPPQPPRIAQPEPSTVPAQTLDAKAIAAVKSEGDCSQAPGEPKFFRLDASHPMGLIPCMLGAYQASSMVVIIKEAGDWPSLWVTQNARDAREE